MASLCCSRDSTRLLLDPTSARLNCHSARLLLLLHFCSTPTLLDSTLLSAPLPSGTLFYPALHHSSQFDTARLLPLCSAQLLSVLQNSNLLHLPWLNSAPPPYPHPHTPHTPRIPDSTRHWARAKQMENQPRQALMLEGTKSGKHCEREQANPAGIDEEADEDNGENDSGVRCRRWLAEATSEDSGEDEDADDSGAAWIRIWSRARCAAG